MTQKIHCSVLCSVCRMLSSGTRFWQPCSSQVTQFLNPVGTGDAARFLPLLLKSGFLINGTTLMLVVSSACATLDRDVTVTLIILPPYPHNYSPKYSCFKDDHAEQSGSSLSPISQTVILQVEIWLSDLGGLRKNEFCHAGFTLSGLILSIVDSKGKSFSCISMVLHFLSCQTRKQFIKTQLVWC